MKHDELQKYYYEKTTENIFYPVRPEDLYKTNKFVITVEGLKHYTELKRKIVMRKGEPTDQEKADFVALLNMYASTNGDLEALKEWNDYLFRYARDLDLIHHKTTLYKRGFIQKNKDYNPKIIKFNQIWRDAIGAELKRLRIKEYGEYIPD